MTAAVLAIDAGNSKTDVALVTGSGEVLAWVRGGGFHPDGANVRPAVDMIGTLVARIAPATVDHVAAYLANCDLPVEREHLLRAISARGWGARVEVDNDIFAVLRAGAASLYGVAVVCGAGMNCLAVAPDGLAARYPALGRLSGDWGGGEFLGEEMLWHAMRGEDGRGPRTDLQGAVAGHFRRQTVTDVCLALHQGELPHHRLHELAAVLFAVADAGDAVARCLVERLGDEVGAMAAAAMRRLGVTSGRVPVVLGGGVLKSRHPLMLARVEKYFAEAGVDVAIQILTDPPIVGSALLGLDALSLGSHVETRLRAAFAAREPETVAP